MISDNLQAVRARIDRAARANGRDGAQLALLAVSKTHPPDRVLEACDAGQRAFGENYVQEAVRKMDALADLLGKERASRLEWHLIGPLQANKARIVAERFAWVHTVDREKIARRLSDLRPQALPPLNVLIQLNISGEATKSGVAPPELPVLARAVVALPHLRLRGLMAIPEPSDDAALQRARFGAVRRIYEELNATGMQLDTLSMGMSDDLEAAIAEGSTMVRVGTAIFGARQPAIAAA
jgi:pyridoxal phosphate enzyme (YggS family)